MTKDEYQLLNEYAKMQARIAKNHRRFNVQVAVIVVVWLLGTVAIIWSSQ